MKTTRPTEKLSAANEATAALELRKANAAAAIARAAGLARLTQDQLDSYTTVESLIALRAALAEATRLQHATTRQLVDYLIQLAHAWADARDEQHAHATIVDTRLRDAIDRRETDEYTAMARRQEAMSTAI